MLSGSWDSTFLQMSSPQTGNKWFCSIARRWRKYEDSFALIARKGRLERRTDNSAESKSGDSAMIQRARELHRRNDEVQPGTTRFEEVRKVNRSRDENGSCGGIGWAGLLRPENRGPDAPENAPENASSWGNEREIRADLVTWFCADRQASGLIHARGITVASAKVAGGLNLSAVKVPFPLIFFQCCFSGAITLLYSDLLLLGLDGCLVRPDGNDGVAINADSLRARAVNLRHGFHAFGAVNLRGAEIANNLELDGGHIANPTGVALSLNAARIGGVAFLRNGFTAQGEINLTGAYIGLGVDCSGARFDGGGTSAFTANGSKIVAKSTSVARQR